MSRWAETFAALSGGADSLDTVQHSDGPSEVSRTVNSVTAVATPPEPPAADRELATWGEVEEERAAIVEHDGGISRAWAKKRRAGALVNDHFSASPIGQCAHCGHDARPDDPLVMLFAGEVRADVHASCWRAWQAAQEARALAALAPGPNNQKTPS